MGDRETFVKIVEDLHAMLGNDSMEVAKWLNTPNMALDNESAIYWISKGRMDVVENLLEEFEWGTLF
jgi:hypothetical protein